MRTWGVIRTATVVTLATITLASPALAADSDGDGLRDGFETKYGLTSPSNPDTDGDGVVDSAEDNDGDRLGNLSEQRFGLHPGKRDSDGDGQLDAFEDHDGDGLLNYKDQHQRALPKGLRPTLHRASDDKSPDIAQCQTRHRQTFVRTCVFGAKGSDSTMVVIGDSIMTSYLTPLKRIAKARGIRMVTMTKASCPPFLGLRNARQWDIDRNATCRQWRLNYIKKLHLDPPDYIVFGFARHKLKDLKGKNLPEWKVPDQLQSAIKRTLRKLPATTDVLVLGLQPVNPRGLITCLNERKWSALKCLKPRKPLAQRPRDVAISKGTQYGGGAFGSLYGQICTYSLCPVVQGKTLMYRDSIHLSETFLQQLQPSFDGLLARKLFK